MQFHQSLIDFNGREKTKAVIAQRFYLDDEQVVLHNDDTPRNSKKSDILIGIDKYSPNGVSINLASQYSTVENGFYRSTFEARWIILMISTSLVID